jgi:5-methylcytosine-specific restriction enzyme A
MRKEFPARVKAAALKRCMDEKGIPRCEGCGIVLTAGNVAYDHDTPDGLGGEPTLENCKVLCVKICHKAKTFQQDNPRMQKADRQLKSSFGIKRKSNRWPTSRDKPFKSKIGGGVERR